MFFFQYNFIIGALSPVGIFCRGYSTVECIQVCRTFPPQTYTPPGQLPSHLGHLPPPAVKAKIWKLALTHTLWSDPNRPTTWGLSPNPKSNPNQVKSSHETWIFFWKLWLTSIPDPNRNPTDPRGEEFFKVPLNCVTDRNRSTAINCVDRFIL